eukprot:TRINITY_DN11718_c0_g1_i1.p1 TRINITY_DN11718_c0_g1~~TRINITY_DN11718_c0_g1_i1.p1  ORF type:complete len:1111 (+),score=297.81 TRINITY_DN11718_c0_g1_i1:106-3438(+)
MSYRCHMCRGPAELEEGERPPDPRDRHAKLYCFDCKKLKKAPPCLACGLPVRWAKRGEEDVYHDNCRRCVSCFQVVGKRELVKLAGRMFCGSCGNLFGQFFAPGRRPDDERLKETFEAWDSDRNGSIESGELKRVLKALDPNFAERDIMHLMESIDKNSNGIIEYNEFCDWILQGDPLKLEKSSFENVMTRFMQDAAKAINGWQLNIAEVQLRDDGCVFVCGNGDANYEAHSVKAISGLELITLDPEEFIVRVECNESGLNVQTNTGRPVCLGGTGTQFGPWESPEGFYICGLRVKPNEDGSDRVVGIESSPIQTAKSFDYNGCVRYCAEKELTSTLREILAKSAVDIDAFGIGGVTPLMLASQYGNLASMRLLLSSKAKLDIADEDGWTALTLASKCGQTAAVELLCSKFKSGSNDGGKALSQALANAHNGAARALLRAGMGPAPQGSYALEPILDAAKCKLSAPTLSPAPGSYANPVVLHIGHESVARSATPKDLNQAKAAIAKGSTKGVKLYYTLDGRDPFVVGKPVVGPVKLTGEKNHVRVVAVSGKDRSVVIDAVYVVCHYVVPDEVVSGTLKLRAHPLVCPMLKSVMCEALNMQEERFNTHLDETANEIQSGGKIWMYVEVEDKDPQHKIIIEKPWKLMADAKKQKQKVEKWVADVEKALGEKPVIKKVSKHKGEGKKEHIAIEFTLSRTAEEQFEDQLSDPNSFLRTKAKLQAWFDESSFDKEVEEKVGPLLCDLDIHSKLHGALGKKNDVDEVTGLGEGDKGVIAMLCAEADRKKIKKKFGTAVADAFKQATVGEVQVAPGELYVNYSIDILNGVRSDGHMVNGGEVVKMLNTHEFVKDLMRELNTRGVNIGIEVDTPASARELNDLQFNLEWDHPKGAKQEKDYLDGACFVYAEERLCQVVDFRSAEQEIQVHDGADTKDTLSMSRKIARAVTHSGDMMTEIGGEHHMKVNLAAIPSEVTDMYFVLSAYDAKDLSAFPNPAVEIHDIVSGRELSEYTIASAGKSQAVIMGSFSKLDSGKWIIKGIGQTCEGNAKDYQPIRDALADLQKQYVRWENRGDLVKLRLLKKLDRLKKGGDSKFAQLMNWACDMPLEVFQALIKFI